MKRDMFCLQRLFKSAGIDQNHLGPGAMDFAVKFAQVRFHTPKCFHTNISSGKIISDSIFSTFFLRSRSCMSFTKLWFLLNAEKDIG